jgi:hypothetical protein
MDVLSDGSYVGRIYKAAASPVGAPWMWTILVIEDRENYLLTHGYAATREAAIAAFAKSWRRYSATCSFCNRCQESEPRALKMPFFVV